MRTDPSLLTRPAGSSAATRGRGSWLPRGDAIPVVLLALLPAMVFGIPALLGHAVVPGDDMTQNFPLRELAGSQLRAGHLPLYDPWIWSGAPLLGGWNAAAAYPLTWLFAILPGTAAWTAGLIVTWETAGLGMFCFLRALRLAGGGLPRGAVVRLRRRHVRAGEPLRPGRGNELGAAGAAGYPAALPGLTRPGRAVPLDRGARGVRRPGDPGGRAACRGRRAGDRAGLRRLDDRPARPRLVSFGGFRGRGPRPGRLPRRGPVAARPGGRQHIAAGRRHDGLVRLWLAAGPLAAADARSRPARRIRIAAPARVLRGIQPDRGDELRRHPSAGRRVRPARPSPARGAGAAGAGGACPAGRSGSSGTSSAWPGRCSRSAATLRSAPCSTGCPCSAASGCRAATFSCSTWLSAVLLAYWADQPAPAPRLRRGLVGVTRGRTWPETVLGAIPAVAVAAVAVLGLTRGPALLHWLGIGLSRAASVSGQLRPSLIPYAVLGAAAVVLVIVMRRLGPRSRPRLLAGFVAVDLVVFTVLCVVAVGGGTPARAGTAGASSRPAAASAPVRPVAALGYQGRFAIYDPDLLDAGELSALGPPTSTPRARPPCRRCRGTRRWPTAATRPRQGRVWPPARARTCCPRAPSRTAPSTSSAPRSW